jgi:hypothetical protein
MSFLAIFKLFMIVSVTVSKIHQFLTAQIIYYNPAFRCVYINIACINAGEITVVLVHDVCLAGRPPVGARRDFSLHHHVLGGSHHTYPVGTGHCFPRRKKTECKGGSSHPCSSAEVWNA